MTHIAPEVEPAAARLTAADDRIPYSLAASALGVSRRTIERMVSDGRLERDTTATDAAHVARVSRRSLVAVIEARREEEPSIPTAPRHDANVSQPAALDVHALVADLVEAREEAARLGERVRLLETSTTAARDRDDLVARLVAGSWRDRRRARREALGSLVADSTP